MALVVEKVLAGRMLIIRIASIMIRIAKMGARSCVVKSLYLMVLVLLIRINQQILCFRKPVQIGHKIQIRAVARVIVVGSGLMDNG